MDIRKSTETAQVQFMPAQQEQVYEKVLPPPIVKFTVSQHTQEIIGLNRQIEMAQNRIKALQEEIDTATAL
jgi:hypothetical protein